MEQQQQLGWAETLEGWGCLLTGGGMVLPVNQCLKNTFRCVFSFVSKENPEHFPDRIVHQTVFHRLDSPKLEKYDKNGRTVPSYPTCTANCLPSWHIPAYIFVHMYLGLGLGLG